jgi:Fur family ferric uptake transcriptional regulator
VEGKDLRRAGLKVTLPRLKILEILERSATRHMSAEEIYKTLLESSEDIGLATVYRVLTQFEGAGLVARHHFEDGMAVFEINHGTHHDIETRQNAVAARLGYRIQEHSMVLYGRCQRTDCAAKKAGRVKSSPLPSMS